VNTNSTTTPNRRIRRLAGRLALTAVAAGVIGAGPFAAVASADCPFGLPACPTKPEIGPELQVPVRPDFSSIDPGILDDLNDGPVISVPPIGPETIDPGLLDDPVADPGDDPVTSIPPIGPETIDPGLLDDPLLDPDPGTDDPGDPVEETGDPEDTTTTTSVPESDDRDESAADDGEGLAFTGGGTTLALAGAAIAGVGALTVGGAALARRRQQG